MTSNKYGQFLLSILYVKLITVQTVKTHFVRMCMTQLFGNYKQHFMIFLY